MQALRIMRYPVTNYKYHRFLTDTDYSSLPTWWRFGRYPHELANHPVWSVGRRKHLRKLAFPAAGAALSTAHRD
jgi:toxoflavin biosynthesis protein ToxD